RKLVSEGAMISKISFASIPVTDLDRAKAFWSETMGFEVSVDVEAIPGMRWIMLRVGTAETQLHLNDVKEMPETSMPALPFTASDVSGTIEDLRAKGVEIVREPGPAEWDASMTYALFRDSEGNVIMVGS
ncbi:MAG: VOC family protein, partial [Pseudomonadota bacterium]